MFSKIKNNAKNKQQKEPAKKKKKIQQDSLPSILIIFNIVIFFFWIYMLEKMSVQQHVSILWLAPLFLKWCGLVDFW